MRRDIDRRDVILDDMPSIKLAEDGLRMDAWVYPLSVHDKSEGGGV